MSDKYLKIITFAALSFGAIATLGFMAYAGGSVDMLLSGFTLWGLLPFIILYWVTRVTDTHRTIVICTALALMCCLSMYMYYASLFVHPDAQGALIFLFLPLYQLGITLIALGVSAGIGYFIKK